MKLVIRNHKSTEQILKNKNEDQKHKPYFTFPVLFLVV